MILVTLKKKLRLLVIIKLIICSKICMKIFFTLVRAFSSKPVIFVFKVSIVQYVVYLSFSVEILGTCEVNPLLNLATIWYWFPCLQDLIVCVVCSSLHLSFCILREVVLFCCLKKILQNSSFFTFMALDTKLFIRDSWLSFLRVSRYFTLSKKN